MDKTQTTGRTSEDTDALIALLDIADNTPGAGELRARSYELLGVAPDAAIVDVGCGSGRAVAEMAERGRRYVLAEYSWPVVLDRIETDLEQLVGAR